MRSRGVAGDMASVDKSYVSLSYLQCSCAWDVCSKVAGQMVVDQKTTERTTARAGEVQDVKLEPSRKCAGDERMDPITDRDGGCGKRIRVKVRKSSGVDVGEPEGEGEIDWACNGRESHRRARLRLAAARGRAGKGEGEGERERGSERKKLVKVFLLRGGKRGVTVRLG